MNGKFTVTRFGKTLGEATLTEKGLTVETVFSGKKPDDDSVYRLAAVCGGKYVLLGVPIPDDEGGLKLSKTYSKTALRDIGFGEPAAFELVLPGEKYNAVNTPESELEPESEPEPEREPEPKLEPEPEPEPEPKLEPEPEPQPELKQKPQQEPQPELKQKPEPESQPEPKLKPQPEPEPEPEPQLEPEYKPEPEKALAKSSKWRVVNNPTMVFSDNGVLSSADEITGALLREEGDTAYLAVPISESEPFPLMAVFCLGEAETIDGGDYLVFKLKNGVFSA